MSVTGPSMFTRMALLAWACAVVTWTASLQAQATRAQVTLSAGSTTDTRGARTTAWTLAPGLLFRTQAVAASIGARYSGYTAGRWAAGAGGSMLAVAALGERTALLVEARGDHSRTSYHDVYTLVEAVPLLRGSFGRVTVSAGPRFVSAWTAVERSLPGGPLSAATVVRERSMRSLWGPRAEAALDLRRDDRAALRLTYREEHLAGEALHITDRRGGITGRAGPVGFLVSAGHQSGVDQPRSYLTLGVGVELAPGVTLRASTESYPTNPLTLTPAGHATVVSAALGLGRLRGRAGPPVPRGVSHPPQGFTRVTIRAPEALRVEVAGDWNQWSLEPARPSGNGVWYADLPLEPGEYRYAFRIDGRRWRVPDGVPVVKDGYGGMSAWLTVRDPTQSPRSTP